MPSRSARWTWVLLVAAAALIGMFLVSVIGLGSKQADLVIRIDRVPDVSRYAIPKGSNLQATTPKLPTVIWLVRDGDTWLALGNQSAHPRACEVVWHPELAEFTDPCLGTVYDRTGLNVAGPAPRGLDAYPVKVSERAYVGKLVTVDLTKPKPVTKK
jgi:hypothetical protein